MPTTTHLNVLPLGSYIMLLGMIGCTFARPKWMFMTRSLSAWMIMDKKNIAGKEESYISENGYNHVS